MNNVRLVLNDRTIARIADLAEASDRSVWKRLAGGRIRGRVQGRIDRAIASVLGEGWVRPGGGPSSPLGPKPAA